MIGGVIEKIKDTRRQFFENIIQHTKYYLLVGVRVSFGIGIEYWYEYIALAPSFLLTEKYPGKIHGICREIVSVEGVPWYVKNEPANWK